MPTEENKFLEALNQSDPNHNDNLLFKGEKPEEKEEEKPEEVEDNSEKESLRNRRERRMAQKLEKYKQESLLLAERLKLAAEKPSKESESDYLKRVEEIFGNADEKGVYDPGRARATELLKSALADAVRDAEERALKRFEEREQELTSRQEELLEQNEDYLDEALDEVEDEYGINMNSAKERNAYLELLEEMSPKDEEGGIIEYADPKAVAKVYLKVRGSATSQAKQISSRSMTQGGSADERQAQDNATLQFMRENNLL